MSLPPFLLIANPENRRVSLFQDALASLGEAPAQVLSWLDILSDIRCLEHIANEPRLVRIDSFGEDFDVEKLLMIRGYPQAKREDVWTLAPDHVRRLRFDRGRIWPPRQQYLGLVAVLHEIDEVLAGKEQWQVLNQPSTIIDLFDKRITANMYETLGLSVARHWPNLRNYEQMAAQLTEAGVGQAFVKFSSTSSASCLGIWRQTEGKVCFQTTMESSSFAMYNSLRLREYTQPTKVAELVTFLLREGAQVEERIEKATLDGNYFDCRVVVIDGEPLFWLVRQSEHEITNLHLGGRRGNREQLFALIPPELMAEAHEACRTVFRAHRSFQIGLDLMFSSDLKRYYIVEANAFGDLLPNLTLDGWNVYQTQIRRLQEKYQLNLWLATCYVG
jgi:hypothetical protein